MKRRTRARARLLSQGLVGPGWDSALGVVNAFGLMQGQETTVFSSIALRTAAGMESVYSALENQEIVRGYPMRGTVFAAPAADMRWMTELMAKPGPARAKDNCCAAGISATQQETIRDLVLAEGPVSNAELKDIVSRVVGIEVPETAMVYRSRYLLLVDGTCAYLGVDQRLGAAPDSPGIEERFNGERQAAVNTIVRGYVATHGPVTFSDVAWWSKLPVGEIAVALENLGEDFIEADGDYLRCDLARAVEQTPDSAFRVPHLLPPFDEYILGYKDRLFAMSRDVHTHLAPRNMGIFRKSIVVDGEVRATWKGAGGKLVIEDVGGIPKYANSGIKRKFLEFPTFAPAAGQTVPNN